MKKPNIAILGATGVVGREITKITEELNIEFNTIKFLSSAKSAGSKIRFKGGEYIVEEATPSSFDGVDIVMASAGGTISQKFAPEIIKRGGLIIDNSSAFRMEESVPLVIAGVNDEDLRLHKGIIANQNCSTPQLMLPLKALDNKYKVKRMIVSTYQAVSGAGLKAINELTDNIKTNLVGMPYEPSAFKYEIAFNVIPQIDTFCENGYTKEEMKVTNETRKILHFDENVKISCTAVRVPVYVGHSESVSVEFENKIDASEARELLKVTDGVEVVDDIDNFVYPTPKDAAGKNPVYVGRIRNSIAFDNGLEFFCVADNLRIGAALNTVRIAQKVIEMGLY